ncbi:hypothetical protein ACXZ65_36525 [Streptomyces aculeolatus]
MLQDTRRRLADQMFLFCAVLLGYRDTVEERAGDIAGPRNPESMPESRSSFYDRPTTAGENLVTGGTDVIGLNQITDSAVLFLSQDSLATLPRQATSLRDVFAVGRGHL